MNPKSGKDQPSIRLENAVLDGGMAYRTGDAHSWLRDTLGLDVNTHRSQQRAREAEVFLQTHLFPLAEAGKPPNESKLVDLLVDFKRSRPNQTNGFEMAQLSARLLSRFQCYLLDDFDDPLALGSDSLEREMELFISLASFDFQRIDTAVRERLRSG